MCCFYEINTIILCNITIFSLLLFMLFIARIFLVKC